MLLVIARLLVAGENVSVCRYGYHSAVSSAHGQTVAVFAAACAHRRKGDVYKRQCLHCFNAADNAPLQSEWTAEEAKKLLDEAYECGINAFTITGGEPMLHKNFFDIIEGIYKRNMFVEELSLIHI